MQERSDVKIILDTAKRLMSETPTLDVGIALHMAGVSSSHVRAAQLLDDLLSIDERTSRDTRIITRLHSRPEALDF